MFRNVVVSLEAGMTDRHRTILQAGESLIDTKNDGQYGREIVADWKLQVANDGRRLSSYALGASARHVGRQRCHNIQSSKKLWLSGVLDLVLIVPGAL